MQDTWLQHCPDKVLQGCHWRKTRYLDWMILAKPCLVSRRALTVVGEVVVVVVR